MALDDICISSWGNTSITKSSYIDSASDVAYTAYSASGPDGSLAHFEHEGTGIVLSAIGARCGKTWFATGRWTPIKNTIYFKSRDESLVLNRFLYWYTNREELWPRSTSAQPFISLGDTRTLMIPIPPLDQQIEITNVLDRFEFLLADISVGLPAEIGARRRAER